MGIFDFFRNTKPAALPFDIPSRGKSWHPEPATEPHTGHAVIWPAAGADGMSGCFDPRLPVYHAVVVLAAGRLPASETAPPTTRFLQEFLVSELDCLSTAFGRKETVAFDGARIPEGWRQVDYQTSPLFRTDWYEFSVKTRSWIGPENHVRPIRKSLEKLGAGFASKRFLVPKTYTLLPHHELALDGLLRVSYPVSGERRDVFMAFGFGSRFTEGYLEANNWPAIKPEVSGFLYGTNWRLSP